MLLHSIFLIIISNQEPLQLIICHDAQKQSAKIADEIHLRFQQGIRLV